MPQQRRFPQVIVILTALAVVLIPAASGKTIRAVTENRAVPIAKGSIIVLHGLARSSRSMSYIARGLIRQGYIVENIDYPSTRMAIPDLSARYLAPAVDRAARRGGPVHIVSHSMGGILARHYLATHPNHPISRIVMLAPPNGGSELIDTVAGSTLLAKTLGPAAGQLATGGASFTSSLPSAPAEIGIIAGTRSWNPLFSAILPGEDDGKVSVASTRLASMQDHLVLHIDHTLIMWNRAVLNQTLHFLAHGSFTRSPNIH